MSQATPTRLFRLICVLVLSAACGGGGSTVVPPVGPTTLPASPPQPQPPPAPPNAPPRITTLYALNSRVEVDDFAELIADVQDSETSVDELTYEWSSDKGTGTFVGSGRRVRWQAPRLRPTPDPYVLTLTVTENYEEAGAKKQHKVSASTTVHYNDSYREVSTLATTFLNDFATFDVSPEACVRNFTDSCPEKFDELGDIRDNRRNYRVRSGTVSLQSITFNRERTNATAVLSCRFEATVVIPQTPGVKPGQTETANGMCTITAVYEPAQWKWFLCDSKYKGSSSFSLEAPRSLVP